MIEAHDGKAVKGDVFDELVEGAFDAFEVAIVIKVFGIDIGDNGNIGGEFDEGAVALVGFDDHPLPRPKARIGAVGIDDPAIDDGGIKITGIKKRTTGSARARAAISSGLSRLMAEETTTTSALPRLSPLWPISTFMPMSRRRWTLGLSEASEPWTV
jgi:hypothetical protein